MVPYHDIFRKPSPGTLYQTHHYCIGCLYYLFQHILGLPFSLNTVQSIPCAFVGDSAGRHGGIILSLWTTQLDYSDVDVLLAINAHFKFYTTEAFFLDSTDPHDTVIKKEDLPSFNPIQYRTDYKSICHDFKSHLQCTSPPFRLFFNLFMHVIMCSLLVLPILERHGSNSITFRTMRSSEVYFELTLRYSLEADALFSDSSQQERIHR